jgi:uncharacterized protein YjdB
MSLIATVAALVATLPAAAANASPTGATGVSQPSATAPKSVCYDALLPGGGWQGEKCDGSIAGTTGQALRMEGLWIMVSGAGTWCAQGHVQNIGWQPMRCAGDGGTMFVGTLGQPGPQPFQLYKGTGLRLEAVRLTVSSGTITAQAHVQNIGWQDPQTGTDVTVGTTGQALRMEAITITNRN